MITIFTKRKKYNVLKFNIVLNIPICLVRFLTKTTTKKNRVSRNHSVVQEVTSTNPVFPIFFNSLGINRYCS